MERRQFIAAGAAMALPLRARLRVTDEAPRILARPFDLSRVRLLPGPFLDATQVNRRFLMAQDPDRLLHTFRLTAALPSSAEPLGGWEAPINELRGHYTGHYLSACARMGASTGDAEVRSRGERMVAELARCQQPNGYLSAFPEEFFDRLRAGRPVWAPFYTIHKIMAGLLDTYTLSGNAQALDVLRGMARWTAGWAGPLGEYEMARVLEREYGGMNELFYTLAALPGQQRWQDLAHRFDHERFFAPLAIGRDELKGLHVNTNVPKVVGAARRWELTGEHRYRDIAEYFWHEVTGRRCYCTGGTSNGEVWKGDPGELSTELSGYTQEDCTTYNMLKLTRHLFGWAADARVADYYERALWNGILGSQHPQDGEKLYYVSLASGLWKLFGTPTQDYWCCTGTMSESFSGLGEGIYFHDESGVWVNLFIASVLDWAEQGVRLTQETTFPESDTTQLTVHAARPARFALRVRAPWWATGANAATLNGRALEALAAPGGYLVVDRTWRDGDRLQLRFPMRLYAHPMPDDPSLQALMYGPLVLAGRMGTDGLTAANLRAGPTPPTRVPEYNQEPVSPPSFTVPGDDPSAWAQPTGRPLEFRTSGQSPDITMVPFYRVFDERYGIYWRVNRRA